MAETKPITTPEWNTGGANRATPNGAKIILGWVLNEKPVSSAFKNWIEHWSGAGWKWLYERVDDGLRGGGGDEEDVYLHPPAPTDSVTGGAMNIAGADALTTGGGGAFSASGGDGAGAASAGGTASVDGGVGAGTGAGGAATMIGGVGGGGGGVGGLAAVRGGLATGTDTGGVAALAGGAGGAAGGDGGAAAVTGGAAVGTDTDGGDTIIGGGNARGDGSSLSALWAAVKGGAGGAARVAEEFLKADGSLGTYGRLILSKPTVILGAWGLEAGLTVDTTGGTGPAVEAFAEDDHGLRAGSKSASPVKSSLGIDTQNADPTSPSNGSVYPNSLTDQLNHHSAVLGRFQAMDSLVYQKSVPVTETDVDNSAHTFNDGADVKYTIPANTLRVGSLIKIRMWGQYNHVGVPDNLCITSVQFAGTIVGQDYPAASDVDREWRIEAEILIQTLGGAGTAKANLSGMGQSTEVGGGVTEVRINNVVVAAGFSTAAAIDITAVYDFAAAGEDDEITLNGFTVEVL